VKSNASRSLSKWIHPVAVAIFAIGFGVTPAVYAGPHAKDQAGTPANVVAHVELSSASVTQMMLVKKNGDQYLLLGLDSSTVAIMDVSEPSRPRRIATATGAAGPPAAELKLVADTLTVFGTSDADSAASAIPKEIRNLSGVTAFIRDKTHGLIYAANRDGLWIVKTRGQAAQDDADSGGGG